MSAGGELDGSSTEVGFELKYLMEWARLLMIVEDPRGSVVLQEVQVQRYG